MTALVTLVAKDFQPFYRLRNTKTLWPLSSKYARVADCEEVKATLCVFLLNNAYSLHLSQRVDKQRGGLFISEFTELLNASWEEGEILRGRVLRKASVITFSFEPAFVPCRTFFIVAQDVITNVTRLKVQQ